MSEATELYFRVVPHNGGLVFATPERAEYIHSLHCALGAPTWADFRKAMPPDEFKWLLEYFEEQDEVPEDTDPLPEMPGESEGGYPPWLQPEMDDVLPREVLEAHGALKDTFLNGGFWMIPASSEKAVCQDLEKLGYEVQRREDLEFW